MAIADLARTSGSHNSSRNKQQKAAMVTNLAGLSQRSDKGQCSWGYIYVLEGSDCSGGGLSNPLFDR